MIKVKIVEAFTDGQQQEATTDTTVQEKNITYPTDNKLHRKIIKKCIALQIKMVLNDGNAIPVR